MGWAISKFESRISDLSKRNQPGALSSALTLNACSLHTFLHSDNPNPKCIFIFGGNGSNKGEFIWEMLSHSSQKYMESDKNEAVKRLLGLTELRLNVIKYAYHYIDIEKLIIDNLDKRIQKLSTNMQMNTVSQFTITPDIYDRPASNNNATSFDSPEPPFVKENSKSHHKSRRRSSATEELRTKLLLYANIVTNSWILLLIKKEIEENNFGPFEKIFIINLIPNKISLFKNCLYLKQSPSFVNFNFNYLAINLVKNNIKKKDFDIKYDEQFEDVSSNFINYFRLINKLIDIRMASPATKLRLRLTTSKNAFAIRDLDQLISFLYMPKKAGLEVDIFGLEFHLYAHALAAWMARPTQTLTFVLNDEIELDDQVILVLAENNIDIAHVRKFIALYKIVQYSMNFVIETTSATKDNPDDESSTLSPTDV